MSGPGRRALWLRWSWRDLRNRWAQVAAIAAIIALGSGIYSGFTSTGEWRRVSLDASYAALAMYDLRLALAEGNFLDGDALVAAIRAIPSATALEAVEPRLVTRTQVDASTGGETILVPGRVVGVDVADGGPHVNRVSAERGRTLRASDAGTRRAVLEYHFADHYGLPARGDIRVSGGERLRYVGQGLSPEYFFVRGDQGSLLAEANFAVVFTPLDVAQELAGRPGAANDVVLKVRDGTDPQAVAAEIRAALAASFPEVGADLTLRDDDEILRMLYDDIDGDQRFYNILAFLTLAGAAFAAFNLAGRMIEAQRRELGIGMALGVPPRGLAVRPLLVGAQIAALGALFGIVVGLVVGHLMAQVLEGFFPLPVWDFPFQPGAFLRGAALGLVLPFAATAFPVWRAVRVTPIEAIRTGALAPTRVSPLVRVPLPGRTLQQLPFRNVLRAPRRTLLTALGIAAAIAVLVAVVGLLDSFGATIDDTERELLRGSPERITVDLDGFVPVTAPVVAAVAGDPTIGATQPNLRLGGRLVGGGERIDVLLTLTDLDHGLWRPRLDDRVPAGDLPGIVLARKAARDLGVRPGDRIELRHPRVTGPASFEYARSPVRVIATSPIATRFFAVMDLDDAGLMGLSGITNSLSVVPAAGSDEEAVRKALFSQPGVASVQQVRMITQTISDAIEEFAAILYIVAGIVLLLALLIAFNSASINSDERRRDHATMFAFGLPVRRVLGMAVVESALVGGLGTVAGIAGGRAILAYLVNVELDRTFPDLGIETVLATRTLLLAALLGVVAVAIAPLLGARRIRRMDIPSTLRVVE